MAHTKAGGSTQNNRDSQAQRLGVKLFAGQKANAGAVLIRQHGLKFRPGRNVERGRDDTLYATREGVVSFSEKSIRRFTGTLKKAVFIHVD
jgi:large subunit ribosomal protein L27